MRVLAFLAGLTFSSLALSNPELLKAAEKKKWDKVIRLLEEDPTVDVNFARAEGAWRGYTTLYHAAADVRFDLVERILNRFPHANLNNPARPALGYQSPSVIWFAGFYNRWDLVKSLLQRFPQIDVDFAHAYGPYAHKNLLRLAAHANRWDIMEQLILLHPLIAFESTLANELLPGSIVKLMLLQRLRQPTFEDINSNRYANQAKALWANLRRAVMAMPQICEAVIENQPSWSQIPLECQEIIIIHSLRANDPDLDRVPEPLLRHALEHFRTLRETQRQISAQRTIKKRERIETAAEEGNLNEGDLKRQVIRDFPYIEEENIAPVAEALAENLFQFQQISPFN